MSFFTKIKGIYLKNKIMSLMWLSIAVVIIAGSSIGIVLMNNKNVSPTANNINSGDNSSTASFYFSSTNRNTSSPSIVVTTSSNPSKSTNSVNNVSSSVSHIVQPTSSNQTASLVSTVPLTLAEQDEQRANEFANQYYTDFYNANDNTILYSYPGKKLVGDWGLGTLMGAVDRMAAMNKKNIPMMNKIFAQMDYYGSMKNGKFYAYQLNRGDTPMSGNGVGISYDDNMWIAIAFLRGYAITGNSLYLSRAEQIVNMLETEAWCASLGGFYWDYSHGSRNTCSNNPMIKLYCDLYKTTGKQTYLDWAKKVYNFSVSTFKNTQLNIYYDLVGIINNDNPSQEYYTYNTGTMISGAAGLYSITHEQKYLTEALQDAEGAYNYFGNKSIAPPVVDFLNFRDGIDINENVILLRGYIDLYPYAKSQTAKYIEAFQTSIDYGYNNFAYNGIMPVDWIRGYVKGEDRNTNRTTLDQSAPFEIYAMLAIWQKSK